MVYKETQAFGQKWVFYILVVVLTVLIAGYIGQAKYHKTFGNHPMSNGSYTTCIILVVGTAAFFYFAKLETQIDEFGISYKFPPFQIGYKLYAWKDLDKAYVRTFSPLGEYGGWGYKITPNGTMIAVNGDQGIQLITTTGKHILIGTCNPGEASHILEAYPIKSKID